MPFSNNLLKGFFIMENNDLMFIQSQIGYEFKNLDLLQQAFTRRSYSEENGGENNEVLEFIGDKVLDLFAVKYLITHNSNSTQFYKKFDPKIKNSFLYETERRAFPEENTFISDLSEKELTEAKKLLVQKKTLANRIDKLGISYCLLMGKGDILQNANEENSVKEDLFEAILGAIAIDCDWNMTDLQNAVEIMLAPESILAENDYEEYVSLIEEWSHNKVDSIPLYHFENGSYTSTWYIPFDGVSQHIEVSDNLVHSTKYHCLLKLSDDLPIFRGFGRSQTEARKNVCKLAYDYLCNNGYWLSISDEIANPNKDDAINQLEILARRGYFSIPDYDFEQTYDENGNPIWKSTCSIKEKTKTFSAKSSAKKDAKKSAAYKMLQYVLSN
jgi:ribonuclease-3